MLVVEGIRNDATFLKSLIPSGREDINYMRKIIPIFLTVCLVIILTFLWLTALDDNAFYQKKAEYYFNLKTPSKSVICPAPITIYEPELIYQEVVKRDCPICERNCPICEKCDYAIWEKRVNIVNQKLREEILRYKLNCRQ